MARSIVEERPGSWLAIREPIFLAPEDSRPTRLAGNQADRRADERGDEGRDKARIVLPVAVEGDDDRRPCRPDPSPPRHALAEGLAMGDPADLEPLAGEPGNYLGGRIRASVVDDDDLVASSGKDRGDLGQQFGKTFRLVQSREDDRELRRAVIGPPGSAGPHVTRRLQSRGDQFRYWAPRHCRHSHPCRLAFHVRDEGFPRSFEERRLLASNSAHPHPALGSPSQLRRMISPSRSSGLSTL